MVEKNTKGSFIWLVAANDNIERGDTSSKVWACADFIYIPPIEILTLPHIIRRMAIVLKNLMYVSRQERAAQFRDVLLSYDGDVFGPKELWFDHLKICPWHVLGVTNSKCELEGDASAWWIGAFLRFADNEPKIVTPNNLSRYELIYLVIAIKYPHLINKILA